MKQCIEFYYLWKKNYPDVIRRLRVLRRKRELGFYSGLTAAQRAEIAGTASSSVGDKNGGRRKSNSNSSNGGGEQQQSTTTTTTSENGGRRANGGKNRNGGGGGGVSGTSPMFECPKCSRRFKKFRLLNRHLKTNHSQ